MGKNSLDEAMKSFQAEHEREHKRNSETQRDTVPVPDPVNSPSHYAASGVEVIDAIEAWGLDKNFCLGNVIKYVARAGKKDPAKLIEDLKKSRWYLDREIEKLEKAKK